MKAISIKEPQAVEIEEVEEPSLGGREVLLRILAVGICATDVHIAEGSFPTARYPVRPGHEAVGRVVEVGAGVTALLRDDLVVIDPGFPCRSCLQCQRGLFNLCERRQAYGISLPGAAAEFAVISESNCIRVPDGVPIETAVLAEPLACVVHGFDQAQSLAGGDVLIYGSGTIGLLAAQVARHLGASSVSIVDVNAERVENALGIEGIDSAATSASGFGVGREWDLVVDATGAVPAIEDGLGRLRRGGTFLQLGVARRDSVVGLRPYDVFAKELRIVGSMTTRHSFPRAMVMLAAGAISGESIVSPLHALEDYSAALQAVGAGRYAKQIVSPGFSSTMRAAGTTE